MNTTVVTSKIAAPDLTKRAPRSPRVRLGGFAKLPRLIDKCRADINGTIGEYHTNCAIDQEFLSFTGIEYTALRERIAEGRSDGELLEWINENSTTQRSAWEINAWTEYQNLRAPAPHTDLSAYFLSVLENHNKERCDIRSWADLLDLDDYCSFEGAA